MKIPALIPNPLRKAKLYNHEKVIELSKDIDIKSGIMFNHESEFRGRNIYSQKLSMLQKR